jgi:hypothetical protein
MLFWILARLQETDDSISNCKKAQMKTLHLSITFLAQTKLMSQQQLSLLFDTIVTSKPFCLKQVSNSSNKY